MKYRPGKAHGNADALSCIPIVSIVQDICSLDTIRQAQHADDQLKLLISALESQQTLPGSLAPGLKQAFLLDGVLCHKFGVANSTQMVIPESLQSTVLEHVHNKSVHLGVTKTMGKVKERFYWPGYKDEIRSWVGSCLQCQQRNPPVPLPQAPLETIQVNYPFEKIPWDIMGPLPITDQGNKYILVITDLFTKWVEAFPLKETSSISLAKVLVDEVVCRFGVPASIHSNQGANFAVKSLMLCVCCWV